MCFLFLLFLHLFIWYWKTCQLMWENFVFLVLLDTCHVMYNWSFSLLPPIVLENLFDLLKFFSMTIMHVLCNNWRIFQTCNNLYRIWGRNLYLIIDNIYTLQETFILKCSMKNLSKWKKNNKTLKICFSIFLMLFFSILFTSV